MMRHLRALPKRMMLALLRFYKREISPYLPDACRFAKRCEQCCEKCNGSDPKLVEVTPGHFVACHFPLKYENE